MMGGDLAIDAVLVVRAYISIRWGAIRKRR